MKISVIIPVFKCSAFIHTLTSRLHKSISSIDTNYELIFVNDCSPLNDWEIITEEARKDSRVKGIHLSRNFGQQNAITAGLIYCKGDWIVVMDGDLQDQPEEIIDLYEKAMNGYSIVIGKRQDRYGNLIKKLFTNLYYKVLSYMTETRQDPGLGNFGIYQRKAIDAILEMEDKTRYLRTMLHWVGFQSTEIPVSRPPRPSGKSGYTFQALMRLAFDNMIGFSERPLRMTVKLGFFLTLISALVGISYMVLFILGKITVSGFTSLIISIWFLSGMIIAIVGVVGIYVGKVFQGVKNRPLFIVEETINLDR